MLKQRKLQDELMDAPDLDPLPHQQALKGLRRINFFSRTAKQLWQHIRPYACPGTTLRILDIGSGGGDVLCRIVQHAQTDGIPVHATGWDISKTACKFATDHAAKVLPQNSQWLVNFENEDAIHGTQSGTFDVVFCSLFLHHLTSQDAATLLQRMKRLAIRAVLVDDLLRNHWGYALACLGTRLLSRSRIVHVDGPMSVEAAFTEAELRQLCQAAGMEGVRVHRHWPSRFLMHWTPT